MQTLVLYLPDDPAVPAPWGLFDAAGVALRTGAVVSGAGLADEVAADRCWVVVPGTSVTAHAIELPRDANERRVAAAAAYALEDALAVDTAELHFALGPAGSGKRLVAVASQTAMDGWMHRLASLGLRADLMLPDFLAIAAGPVMHDGCVLVKMPEVGFAAEADLAAILLGSPVQIPSLPPERFLAQAYGVMAGGAPVSLLQGRYAPKRDWGPVMRPWRRVGTLAASVAILAAAGLAVEGARLNRQAEAATARAEAVFRQALPEVKRVVNPRAQMRAYLQNANLAGAGGFLALSEVAVGATAAVTDAEITSLRFDARRNELAVTFSLPSFDAVERMKNEMTNRGALVHEGGARQDGVRVLADVTVKRP